MKKSAIDLVRSFLIEQEYVKEGQTVEGSASLLEQGIIDSVGMLNLVSLLEETYEIQIDDDDLMPENFDSLVAIENYVKSRVS